MSYGYPSAGGSQGLGIRWLPILLGLLAAGYLLVQGCQEGPFGRHQVVGLSPAQEAQLGAQTYHEVLSKSDVVSSGPLVARVKEIGDNLAQASVKKEFLEFVKLPKQEFNWEFEVVRSRQVNAFCLPGGKVVVYTGIIPVCQTDNGLATVMGHEIGHALAHHGAERIAQQRLVEIGQVAVAASMNDVDPRRRAEIMALLGAGSQFGILLPYSRKHESEADHIGLLLMAAAGYDPRESVVFWQRMEQQGGGRQPEFASTHPSHERRARDLQGWLSKALILYQSSKQQPNRRLPQP